MEKTTKSLDEEREALEKEKRDFEQERIKFDKMKADKDKKKTDLNLMKPVITRKKLRIKELMELSQAKNEKVMRGGVPFWITTRPKMHISKLSATMNNGIVKITYQVYKVDDKGDKILKEHVGKVRMTDGTEKEVVLSANYIFDKLVVETIEHMKPIKIEEFRQNE